MNRRDLLKFLTLPFFSKALFANDKNNTFRITMNGDLDDDLIVLKATSANCIIKDIYQMHNPSGKLKYDGQVYDIKHSPGFISFEEEYQIKDDEVYCICLANEREEESLPRDKRIRTHYKSEKLLFNNQVLFPALMPEYNSVPNYPLWFNSIETPRIDRRDINGDTYNYYKLFENTTVPFGIVVPKHGNIKVMLFNQNNELMYSFNEQVTTKVKNLKSEELKNKKLKSHPFTELNNILNIDEEKEISNNDYIETVVLEYDNRLFTIKMPYPIMYPNLLYTVSVN